MNTPHKCPVCEGSKKVSGRIYDPDHYGVVDCRSCYGTGIVWHGERDTFKGIDVPTNTKSLTYEQTTTMDGFDV